MNPGPLRRLIGSIGLLTLGPVAWMLAQGSLTGTEAAQRAVVVLLLVVLLGRVVGAYLASVATRFDVPADEGTTQARLAVLRARLDGDAGAGDEPHA